MLINHTIAGMVRLSTKPTARRLKSKRDFKRVLLEERLTLRKTLIKRAK